MASDDLPRSSQGRPTRPADSPRTPVVPPGTGTFGIVLFLVALFMLFAAAMVGYVVIREFGNLSPPRGSLELPGLLWVSTALVIAVSFAMTRAVHFIRRERQGPFLTWIRISLALALGFLIVQTPAMIRLLAGRGRIESSSQYLYGFLFFLVLLHALHVVGGMVALVRVALRGGSGVYDHEHYGPVRYAALYWHFLDLIWVLMFGTVLLTA